MKLSKKNLEAYWDEAKVCRNPHKGWYLHYYDNGLGKYGAGLVPGDFLDDFPGLHHLYLRLAWGYLEPAEGSFHWALIDELVERWAPRGFRFAVRVTCKETSADQAYATPKWVRDGGVPGTEIPCAAGGFTWEPDYGHPIFLEKLENFHRAFAERYDGKPWLAYVDIGSYGDWGEAHTAASSHRDWPVETLLRHIDLHTALYRHAPLLISDDVAGSRQDGDANRQRILSHLESSGVGLRDDGVCVEYFSRHFGQSTLRSPEYFERFWRRTPVDLELEHYHLTVEKGTWKGGAPFEKAIEEAHATYIGFHGYAREWLHDNPDFARRMANRAGYWYFLRSIEVPARMRPGEKGSVRLVVENRGVAPAYHRYELDLRVIHGATGRERAIPAEDADNRRWMPATLHVADFQFALPADFPEGECAITFSMMHQGQPLVLPFRSELAHPSQRERYRLASLSVER
jgi:hypothetical protein